jgi:nucleotide-binding universal stress UspA family protein
MYDVVLVPTDGSVAAETAGEHALDLASAFDAEVVALSVVDDRAYSARLADADAEVAETRDALVARARESVAALAALAPEDRPVRTAVETGPPHETIVTVAEREGVDLVAMGTEGRTGLDRLLLGSVAERVLRASEVPVLTTRDGHPVGSGYETVLIPTDGSESARRATAQGVAIADRHGATVHALSVVDLSGVAAASNLGVSVPEVVGDLGEDGEAAVEAVADRCDRRGVDVRTRVTEGTPHRVIRDYVDDEGVDLVAMGTQGRTGLDRLVLGSVAERVLRTSSAPVLAVRS